MSNFKQQSNKPKIDKKGNNKTIVKLLIAIVLVAVIVVSIIGIMQIIRLKKNINSIQSAEVGNFVFFGKYEQDNNFFNGKEDIEWLILEKKDDKALLISKYALDARAYHTKHERTTWEECTLRTWLNGSFYRRAFNFNEMARITTIVVSADKNPNFSEVRQGNDVNNKIFLLSCEEVNLYKDLLANCTCDSTTYARKTRKLPSTNATNFNCEWWSRTMGYDGTDACIVDWSWYNNHGRDAEMIKGVRPTLWIHFV